MERSSFSTPDALLPILVHVLLLLFVSLSLLDQQPCVNWRRALDRRDQKNVVRSQWESNQQSSRHCVQLTVCFSASS
jgi:hypothetical protein